MKILSFESTAKIASCAVTDGERLLASYSINNGLTQSELLMPMAESIMSCLKLGYDELDALACSVGPGSFTGVRIGAALVKGIAFMRDIPCISVSTLEALAENLFGTEGIIVPVMDARRGQVYTAIFKYEGGAMTRITEDMAISTAVLLEELLKTEGKIYLVGDGYEVARRALSPLGDRLMETPPALIEESAYSVARVAARKLARGESDTDLTLMPTYLRVPQAERERLEKNKNNT